VIRDNVSKLDDEVLDRISGGTNQEMFSLQTRTGASNINGITKALDEHGIEAKLLSDNKNEYIDKKTQKPMTHSQVLGALGKNNK
jgi:hypothetical protein